MPRPAQPPLRNTTTMSNSAPDDSSPWPNASISSDAAAKVQSGPVFDAQVLGAMFDHEATVMASVLRTFLSSTSACLAEIAQAAAAQDLTAIAALAHRLRGASRLTGAQALAEVAGTIELAATHAQPAAVQDALPHLERQWQLLQAAITPWTTA